MYLDILIFGGLAAFLVYRLFAVLGTRNGSERERRNPFAGPDNSNAAPPTSRPGGVIIDLKPTVMKPREPLKNFEQMIDTAANHDGRIETGLNEIAAADPNFELSRFLTGARAAFEMIVTTYNKGDLEALKPFVSPKLFADFSAGVKTREAAGHISEVIIHRITASRVNEAHLGGTMAYITVDFDVEETTVTRDSTGAVVDGNPDRIFSIEDIWTFTRDIRSTNPNWTLIETRSVEKAS